MKQKYIDLYIDIAHRVAELSHARRLQVGAIIVKDDVVTYGYNGMPTGWDNNCEDTEVSYDLRDTYFSNDWKYDESTKQYSRLKTKPEVLHAESNAISKIAKSTVSAQDADMFITHSPCIHCAKMIFQAGISRVFYSKDYSSLDGVTFLKKSGIEVVKIDKQL
jgi:dCMP deaminase